MGIRADSACKEAGVPTGRLLAAITLIVCLLVPVARAQAETDLVPCVPDGTINAITQAGGNVYVGGRFDAVGQRSGPGVPLAQVTAGGGGAPPACAASSDPESSASAPVSGQPLHPFPEVAGGSVYAAIPDGSGGWYIGGSFTSVGDQPRDRLAHIRSDGTLDSNIGTPPTHGIECSSPGDCSVRALALDPVNPDVLYVGGNFSGVGSSGDPYLVPVDLSTGGTVNENAQATNWNPPQPDQPVYALQAIPVTIDVSLTQGQNNGADITPTAMSVLIVGGNFTKIGPSGGGTQPSANQLAALWGAGAGQSCNSCSSGSPATAPVQMGGTPLQTGAGASPGSSAAWSVGGFSATYGSVSSLAVGAPVALDSTSGTACAPTASTEPGNCIESIPVYAGGGSTSTPPTPVLKAYWLPIITRIAPGKYSSTVVPGEVTTTGQAYSWTVTPGVGCDGSNSGAVNALALSPQPPLSSFQNPSATPPAASTLYFGGDFQIGSPASGQTCTTQQNLAAVTGITAPQNSSSSPSPGGGALYANWAPATDAPVHALAVGPGAANQPEAVYVGGTFSDLAGTSGTSTSLRNAGALSGIGNRAATDNNTGDAANVLSNWNPSLAGGSVNVLAVSDSHASTPAIYAGGAFESTGAVSRNNLAAFDSSGNLLSWDPDASVNGIDGCSTTYNLANCVPTPVPSTGLTCQPADSSGNTTCTGYGLSCTTPSGTGVNTTCTQTTTAEPSRPTCTTSAPSSPPFNTSYCTPTDEVTPAINALASSPDGSTIYAGGIFDQIGSTAAVDLAAISTSSGDASSSFTPNPDNAVEALADTGDALYVGGYFGAISGASAPALAKLDPASGALVASFAPNPGARYDGSNDVRAINASCGTVYVGGDFGSIGGRTRVDLAALNPGTGAAATWNPNYTDSGGSVAAILPNAGIIYVGGGNFEFGGQTRVAAIDASTGLADQNFHYVADHPVNALTLAGTTLYEGQSFGAGNAGTVDNLLAVEGDSSATDANGNSTWGDPLDLEIDPSNDESSDQAFDPYTTAYPDPDGASDTTADADTPAPDGDVLGLAAYGSTLYIGGDFMNFGSRAQEGFAAIPLPSTVSSAAVNCSTKPPLPKASVTGSGAFGDQAVGTSSAPHTFTITNGGTGPLVFPAAAVSLTGSDAGEYVVTKDGCSGQKVAPNASCTVQLAFAPKAPGSHNSASLQLADNATDSPQALALSGTGVTVPQAPVVPSITGLKESHARWREHATRKHATRKHAVRKISQRGRNKSVTPVSSGPVGTTFSFDLSEPARLTFIIAQARPGRVVGSECLAPTAHLRKRHRCKRIVTVATFTVAGKAGLNAIPFSGRIGRSRWLAPGTYTLALIATDAAGHSSAPQQLSFTILS